METSISKNALLLGISLANLFLVLFVIFSIVLTFIMINVIKTLSYIPFATDLSFNLEVSHHAILLACVIILLLLLVVFICFYVVKNYVKKGTKLYIEGQLQTRKWSDSNGVEKYTTEIVLQNFNSSLQILDSRNSGGESGGSYDRAPSDTSRKSSNVAVEETDDEIPF